MSALYLLTSAIFDKENKLKFENYYKLRISCLKMKINPSFKRSIKCSLLYSLLALPLSNLMTSAVFKNIVLNLTSWLKKKKNSQVYFYNIMLLNFDALYYTKTIFISKTFHKYFSNLNVAWNNLKFCAILRYIIENS